MDTIPSSVTLRFLELSSARQLRVYEAAWIELRKKKVIVLDVIDEGFVPRLKRMISKEKYLDTGFSILNEEMAVRIKYSWDKKRKKLTVRLVRLHGLIDVVS